MTGQECTHWGARPSQSEYVFPHKRALLQTEVILSFISCLGGWPQMIPKVKKPDVEVLGWRCSLKQQQRNGRSILWKPLQWTFLQSACQLHAPSKLQTSVALCCVTKLHILECHYIVPSTRCTCVMIVLFNQLLDLPHLSGGWIVLSNLCTTFARNKLFVIIEHFWDLLLQLMKHGTNTFIYFFSIDVSLLYVLSGTAFPTTHP